jgi:hypothetical protein
MCKEYAPREKYKLLPWKWNSILSLESFIRSLHTKLVLGLTPYSYPCSISYNSPTRTNYLERPTHFAGMGPWALDPEWHANGDSIIALVVGTLQIFYAMVQVFFSWQSYIALRRLDLQMNA